MASIARLEKIARPFLSNKGLLGPVISRTYAYWNKDWKPGPYPTTPEERAAAAKKYGLRPEDYEPYPDDGMGFGDYPKLPHVSAASRDPYENYDHPEFRRNFGEPLSTDFDIITEDKWDASKRYKYSLTHQFLMGFGTIATLYAVYIFFEDYKYVQPYMAKAYPKGEEKHYTFEPVE